MVSFLKNQSLLIGEHQHFIQFLTRVIQMVGCRLNRGDNQSRNAMRQSAADMLWRELNA